MAWMHDFFHLYNENLDKQLKNNDMNENKSVERLADEIWSKVNEPQQVSLREDLKNNSYKLDAFKNSATTDDLILNQAVISDTSMTGMVVYPYRPTGASRPGYANSIVPYLNTTDVSVGSLSFVYESARTGSAGVRLENIIIPQQDREFTEVTVKATNIGGYMDVTAESLEDVEFLSNEIDTGLRKDVELILSNQIINGTGVAPQMDGLLNKATSFAAGTFALSVPTPVYMDVLKCASNMILTAGYNTTIAICHPDDYTRMQFGYNAMQAADFIIVPTTQMTLDNYLIMDGNLVHLYLTGQQIKFADQNTDNAINNRVTVIGTLRAMLKLSPNNVDGVVKGVFSTDLTAITAP